MKEKERESDRGREQREKSKRRNNVCYRFAFRLKLHIPCGACVRSTSSRVCSVAMCDVHHAHHILQQIDETSADGFVELKTMMKLFGYFT